MAKNWRFQGTHRITCGCGNRSQSLVESQSSLGREFWLNFTTTILVVAHTFVHFLVKKSTASFHPLSGRLVIGIGSTSGGFHKSWYPKWMVYRCLFHGKSLSRNAWLYRGTSSLRTPPKISQQKSKNIKNHLKSSILRYKLVGGWATPLKNMKVNWDD